MSVQSRPPVRWHSWLVRALGPIVPRGIRPAIRASLGGRRRRLARQLVVEALVLVGIGGSLGLVLAHFGAGLLSAAMPQQFLGSAGVTIDARVMGFGLLVSIISGIVFATLPALSVSGSAERAGRLLSLGAVRSSSPGTRRTHTVLASVQVALTLALLVGAALFVKRFWQLARIDPGCQAREAVTLQLDLPGRNYPDSASVARDRDTQRGRPRLLRRDGNPVLRRR